MVLKRDPATFYGLQKWLFPIVVSFKSHLRDLQIDAWACMVIVFGTCDSRSGIADAAFRTAQQLVSFLVFLIANAIKDFHNKLPGRRCLTNIARYISLAICQAARELAVE